MPIGDYRFNFSCGRPAFEFGGLPPDGFEVANLTPFLKSEHRAANYRNGRAGWLFCFLDRLNDLVEIRPLAGLEFGMEQFAIGANFEGAAARRNQRKRFNALAEFENFGRQTDGLRRIVSNDAVFD